MINEALKFITEKLNNYLKSSFDLVSDGAVLSNIVNSDGSVPVGAHNKVVVTLINVEKETSTKYNGSFHSQQANGTTSTISYPPLFLNLDVLFSANFDLYEESLKFLSKTILYFQSSPVFTGQQYPDFPSDINKLIFDMEKLSYREAAHLYESLGAKYLPSAIYKMKMLCVDGDQITNEVANISGTSPQVTPNNLN